MFLSLCSGVCVDQCFICNTARPWCLGMRDGGGEESCVKRRRMGEVQHLFVITPLLWFSTQPWRFALWGLQQHSFALCTCVKAAFLYVLCVCVYTGSDTKTTPEHSSDLNGIISCSCMDGKRQGKEKYERGVKSVALNMRTWFNWLQFGDAANASHH